MNATAAHQLSASLNRTASGRRRSVAFLRGDGNIGRIGNDCCKHSALWRTSRTPTNLDLSLPI